MLLVAYALDIAVASYMLRLGCLGSLGLAR